MITALQAKTHSMWKRLFHLHAAEARLADRVTYSPESSHSPSAYVGLARSRSLSPRGLSWETWTTLAAGGLAVSFRRGKLQTKASLVDASCLWCCFPSPVERKGQPMTNAKQTCSSSPVQWMWNRVTQIWMETIANISQQGLWKKHLAGPLSREFN